jgi:hypothetical protein
MEDAEGRGEYCYNSYVRQYELAVLSCAIVCSGQHCNGHDRSLPIHRWDYRTPIEGILCAFNDAGRSGDVRYLGTSSVWAYQFAEALHTSDRLSLNDYSTHSYLFFYVRCR